MAASGGVTFLLEEKSLFQDSVNFTDELYCDMGGVIRIDTSNLHLLKKANNTGAFAYKGYLYPPSSKVGALPQDLPAVLSKLRNTGVPLIIDPSIPQVRMLFMASPCRLMNLNERIHADVSKDLEFFAGAFPDSIYPDDDGEFKEESVRWNPERTRSGLTSSARLSVQLQEPARNEEINVNLSQNLPDIEVENMTRTRGFTTLKDVNKRRQSSYHNIYEDLDFRINAIQSEIEALSKADLTTYQTAGSTVYNRILRKRSSSFSDFKSREFFQALQEEPSPPPASSIQKRLKGKRPIPLNTKVEVTIQKDRIYLNHLANIPDK